MAGGEVKADGKFSGGNEAAGFGGMMGWCLGQMDGATEEFGDFYILKT